MFCNVKYIVFPVSRSASVKKVCFFDGDELVLDLDIGIAADDAEEYMYYNIERFKGKTLRMECIPETDFDIGLSDCMPEDTEKDIYRPLVHFSARRGWINDPNGLVYHNGVYHMFFQHNPVGTVWGNMHWGHAVSRDLINWEQYDDVLFPDERGSMFSGSAIADRKNLLGLNDGESNAMVLFYTAAGDTSLLSAGCEYVQCMAYSTDNGRTFVKKETPVVESTVFENRDPKVIYCEDISQYVMALYLKSDKYILLKSENLTEWEKLCDIVLEGDSECPDFYPLPLNGNVKDIRWVFTGANDRYVIGHFENAHFVSDTGVRTLEQGNLAYASQTWSDAPCGRRIRIMWNRFEIPSKRFNGCMTVPCEMSIKETDMNMYLAAYPVAEFKKLYADSICIPDMVLGKNEEYVRGVECGAYDILFDTDKYSIFEISVFGMKITVNGKNGTVECGTDRAEIYGGTDRIGIRIITDTNGVELFANGGVTYLVSGMTADMNLPELTVRTAKNTARIENLSINRLKNAEMVFKRTE